MRRTFVVLLATAAILFTGCSSDAGDSEDAASTTTAPPATTTTAPPATTTTEPAPPPGPDVPVARVGGENERASDPLTEQILDHDLTVEWYSGGATLTAVFRGLDLNDGPPLCLTTAVEPLAFQGFQAETIAPTGDGGCNGATGQVGSIQVCRDLAVYPTAIAITGTGRLFANIQLWEQGAIVTDLSSLESLDAIPPPFDAAALGC